MPGWDELPEAIKKQILAYTLMAPFQGGHVPSIGQLAVNSKVSKEFKHLSEEVVQAKFKITDTIVAMRSDALRALTSLVTALTDDPPDPSLCSTSLYRLSFVPVLKDQRESMQQLSEKFAGRAGQITRDDIQLALAIAKLCMQRPEQLQDAPDLEDTRGLNNLIVQISVDYPKNEYLCVALGGSADPVAVGLAMRGHVVKYLALSGIDNSSEFRMYATDYVNRQVATWPRAPQKLLLIDAIANGTALTVMASLIRLAYQHHRLSTPDIALFALNHPDAHHPGAQELVRSGTVKVSGHDSVAQQRISGQEYKEGALGRLYPKSRGKAPPDDISPNSDALQRMVAALLQERFG